jgi:hypothetical protein
MRPVILLDMDEMLLHTPDEQFLHDGPIQSIPRPGVGDFLTAMKQMGEVWVLSAGSPDYVPQALRSIGILNRVRGWMSSRRRNAIQKNIIKGRRWVLVDDRGYRSPLTLNKLSQCGWSGRRTDGHLITVRPFEGDRGDRVLRNLPGLVGLALAFQAEEP